jgi:L-alanine-DL-glutamate epimerase-like enolase superfamily enzyme
VGTAAGTITQTCLVLIDLLTEEGITGHSYLRSYGPLAHVPLAALIDNIAELLVGEALLPPALHDRLQRHFRLMGTPGLVGMAIAGLDIAAWDTLARACQLATFDAARIGGVTGWMRAAALTHAADTPTSSHAYPKVSAHLLAVTPTAGWLEYIDHAGPLLTEPVSTRDGYVTATDQPGSGIAWDEQAVGQAAL